MLSIVVVPLDVDAVVVAGSPKKQRQPFVAAAVATAAIRIVVAEDLRTQQSAESASCESAAAAFELVVAFAARSGAVVVAARDSAWGELAAAAAVVGVGAVAMHLQPAIVVVADVAGTTPPWRMGLLLLQLHFVAAPAAMHGRGAEAVPRWWMCSSKLLLGCWRLGLPPSRMWGWRTIAIWPGRQQQQDSVGWRPSSPLTNSASVGATFGSAVAARVPTSSASGKSATFVPDP